MNKYDSLELVQTPIIRFSIQYNYNLSDLLLQTRKTVCTLSLQYFESLGFACPPKRDAADFLFDLGTPQQYQYHNQRVSSHPDTSSDYARLFRQSNIYQAMISHVESLHHPLLLQAPTHHMSTMHAFQHSFRKNT